MSELLTVSRAAKILNVAESTVRLFEASGKLTARRDTSGRRLFEREDVERLAKSRQRQAAKADKKAKPQAA